MKKIIAILFLFFLTSLVFSQIPTNTWSELTYNGKLVYAIDMYIDSLGSQLSPPLDITLFDGNEIYYQVTVMSAATGSNDSLTTFQCLGYHWNNASTTTPRYDTLVSALSTAKRNVLFDTLNVQTGVKINPSPQIYFRIGNSGALGVEKCHVYLMIIPKQWNTIPPALRIGNLSH